MARSRRRPPSGAGSSSGSSAYQRRNERARALGYRSYYDYRIHDHGRRPPSEAPVPAGERSRLRGHRGKQDFLRTLKPGDILIVPDGLASIQKDAKGRFVRVDKMVLRHDGRSEMFTFRRQSYDQMVKLIADEADRGAIWSPSPSLDQRRLANVADRPDNQEEGEAE